jgi:hypothetical protein
MGWKGSLAIMEPLYVGLPTRDGSGLITTMAELWMLGSYLKRTIHFLVGEAGNIPRSRNKVLEEGKRTSGGQQRLWILWIDSDIVLPSGGHRAVGDAINWSQATQMAWITNYKMADGGNTLIRDRVSAGAHHYTDAELQSLPEYAEVGLGGFGCCYLPVELDYVFHADVIGEDVHFFLDHPELKLYYAKSVQVKHKKLVVL